MYLVIWFCAYVTASSSLLETLLSLISRRRVVFVTLDEIAFNVLTDVSELLIIY
jgi:hypothetical protein